MSTIVKGKIEHIDDFKASLADSLIGERYLVQDEKRNGFFKDGIEKEEIYVALDENEEFLGFMRIEKNFAFSNSPLLRLIAVKPQYRSKGIGRELLSFYEDLGFKYGNKLFLFVSELNIRARKLYESLGYEKVGAIPGLYVEGVIEYLMLKKRD
jgi:ribosomal protein S18 acetylase RimI-like enzyme